MPYPSLIYRSLIFLIFAGLVSCPLRCQLGMAYGMESGVGACPVGCCGFIPARDCGNESLPLEGTSPQPAEPSGSFPSDCGCQDCVCCGAVIGNGDKSLGLETGSESLQGWLGLGMLPGLSKMGRAYRSAARSAAPFPPDEPPLLPAGKALRIRIQSWQI